MASNVFRINLPTCENDYNTHLIVGGYAAEAAQMGIFLDKSSFRFEATAGNGSRAESTSRPNPTPRRVNNAPGEPATRVNTPQKHDL